MASIIGSVGNVYFVYQFIKKLITPFHKTPAFKLGVIDKKGTILKKRAELETHSERESYTLSDSLVWNLKKLLAKVPGGSTKLATYAAALFLLLKENSTDERLHTDMAYLEEEFNKFTDSDETHTQVKQLINESEKKSFSVFTSEASMLANKLYLMNKAKQLAKKPSGGEKDQEIDDLEDEAKKLGIDRRKYEEWFELWNLYEFAGEEGTDKLVKKYKKVTPGEKAKIIVNEIPEEELETEASTYRDRMKDEKKKKKRHFAFGGKQDKLRHGSSGYGKGYEEEVNGYKEWAEKDLEEKKEPELGSFKLNTGHVVSARKTKYGMEAYKFTNSTQAEKHAAKVGGSVIKPGRVFYVKLKEEVEMQEFQSMMDIKKQERDDKLKKLKKKEEVEEGWKKGKYKVTDGKTGKVLGKFNSGSKAQKYVDDIFQKGDYESLTVELDEKVVYARGVDLDEASKLPPHLAKFFDKDGNLKPEVAARVAKGKEKVNWIDVTPKGYGPKEEVERDFETKQKKLKEQFPQLKIKTYVYNPETENPDIEVREAASRKDMIKMALAKYKYKKSGGKVEKQPPSPATGSQKYRGYKVSASRGKEDEKMAKDIQDYRKKKKMKRYDDLKAYGRKEEVEFNEAKFSSDMIDAMKKKYESLRGKRLSLGQNVELEKIVKQLAKDKEALTQLVKADIPFISMNARLILNKDYGVPLNQHEEVELDETWEVGAVYHQEYKNGDRTYFRADSAQKNKRWKGMSVDEIGGRLKKPKNNTADEKVMGWAITPENEIPKVLKEDVEISESQELQAKMALDDAGIKWELKNNGIVVKKKDLKKAQLAFEKSFKKGGWPRLKTEEYVSEKAVSQQQQKFMGIVRSIQKGKASGSPEAEKAAKEMDPEDVEDFASTKHKGLPKRKKEVDEDRSADAEQTFQQAMLAFKKKGGKINKLKDSPAFKSLFGPGYKSKKMPRQARDIKAFGEGRKYKLKNNEETGVSGVAGIGADTTSKLGSDQSEPGARRKKRKKWLVSENSDSFAGINVFDVNPTHFELCRMGKRKYLRYEKYVGNDDTGESIRQYGRNNPKAPIILKNSQTGAMLYLRYGRAN